MVAAAAATRVTLPSGPGGAAKAKGFSTDKEATMQQQLQQQRIGPVLVEQLARERRRVGT